MAHSVPRMEEERALASPYLAFCSCLVGAESERGVSERRGQGQGQEGSKAMAEAGEAGGSVWPRPGGPARHGDPA